MKDTVVWAAFDDRFRRTVALDDQISPAQDIQVAAGVGIFGAQEAVQDDRFSINRCVEGDGIRARVIVGLVNSCLFGFAFCYFLYGLDVTRNSNDHFNLVCWKCCSNHSYLESTNT